VLSAETLARLSVTERLLIWVLGSILAGLVGYTVFYVPAIKDLRAATNELEAARARHAAAEKEVADARGLADDLAGDEQALAREVAQLPGADGVAHDLLFVVPELARRAGATIERWRPLPEQPVGAWGVARPVQIDMRATWPCFAEFLRKVEEQREVVAIDALTILDPQRDDGALEISFRASALRVHPRVAQGAPAAPDSVASL